MLACWKCLKYWFYELLLLEYYEEHLHQKIFTRQILLKNNNNIDITKDVYIILYKLFIAFLKNVKDFYNRRNLDVDDVFAKSIL